MSSRDDPASHRLSAHLVFCLVILACCLAVHFVAENIGPAGNPATGGSSARSLPACAGMDGCDNEFVSPLPAGLPMKDLTAAPEQMNPARPIASSASPLLPPPNS